MQYLEVAVEWIDVWAWDVVVVVCKCNSGSISARKLDMNRGLTRQILV